MIADEQPFSNRYVQSSGWALLCLWAGAIYWKFYSAFFLQHWLSYGLAFIFGGYLLLKLNLWNSMGGVSQNLKRLGFVTLGVLWVSISILYSWPSLLLIASIAAWFYLGRSALKIMEYRLTGLLEKYVLSVSIGMVIYADLVLLLGLVGLLYRTALILLTLFSVLLGYWFFRDESFSDFSRLQTFVRRKMSGAYHGDSLPLLVGLFIAFYFLVFVLGNLTPPYFNDYYHLIIAKRFAEAHRIFSITDIDYSNLPLCAEMLYTQGIVFGSSYIYGGMVNLVFVALLLGAFLLLGQRVYNRVTGGMAFLFFFSIPYYTYHVFSASADLKYLLFALLALYALLQWRNSRSPAWLSISGLLAGCAASFRYQGLMLGFLLLLLIGWRVFSKKEGLRPGILQMLRFNLFMGLTGFVWYLKNLIYAGNPIFPTCFHWFHGYFGDPIISEFWRDYGDPKSPFIFGYYGLGVSLKSYLRLPWHLTFYGGNFEGYSFTPVYLALAPMIILIRRLDFFRTLLIFCFLYTTVWFFQMQQLKFLMPAFTVFGFLAATATCKAWSSHNSIVRLTVLLLAFVPTVFALKQLYTGALLRETIPTALRLRSPELFLVSHSPSQPLVEFINTKLPADARLYTVGPTTEVQFFFAQRPIRFGIYNFRDVNFRNFSSFDQFLSRLQSFGITHLIFPDPSIPAPPIIDPSQAAYYGLLKSIHWQTLDIVWKQNGIIVARINYDRLPPEARIARRQDLVQVGDILLQFGSFELARMQYEEAVKAGHPLAQNRLNKIESMTPLQKGDYFLAKAREFQSARFLKGALNEYESLPAGSADFERAQEGKKAVVNYGIQIAPQIWAHP